jgi:RNA-binding motif protein, X-linked 2
MNYLTNIKNTQKATRAEIDLGIAGDKASWHARFAHSAYVFAGGLPFELTEGDVLAVFSQYGEIVDLHLVRDKQTAKSRGFAFLAYEDQRSTVLAVDNLSGARVAGRTVRVEHVDNYRKKRAEVEGEPEPSSTPHAEEEEQREERRQQAAQRAREAPAAGGGGGFGREDEGRGAVESGDGKGGGGGSVAEILQEARRKGLANWQAMLAAGGGGAAMLDEGQVERRRERDGGRTEKGKDKGVHRHHDRRDGREKRDKRDAKHKRSKKDKKAERTRSRSASPRRRRSRSR